MSFLPGRRAVAIKLIVVAAAVYAYGILCEIVKMYATGRPLLISHGIGAAVAGAVVLVVIGARLLVSFRVDVQGMFGTFARAWALCATVLAGLTAAQADWFNFGLVDFAVDALFVFLVSLACALLVRCFFAAPHEE